MIPARRDIERELRRRYLLAHHTLHAFWTAAVGGDGYRKSYWMALERDLTDKWRAHYEALRLQFPIVWSWPP